LRNSPDPASDAFDLDEWVNQRVAEGSQEGKKMAANRRRQKHYGGSRKMNESIYTHRVK